MMSFIKTNIAKLLFVVILFIPHYCANAATHEIGIGASLINKNDDFNKGYGFNIHYDYSPNDYFALRTSISGDFLNKNTLVVSDYWKSQYTTEIKYFFFSIEESMLFKAKLNKFEPYMGFGISFYFVDHNLDNLKHLEVIENSVGLNIRGGFKYPLISKLFTYFEAKYSLSINSLDDTTRSGTFRDGGIDYNLSYIVNGNINLNRLELHAGISFRL